MARPATECRNEVKSRLRDDAFAAVQCAMRLYECSESECSESRAVAILVERGAYEAWLLAGCPRCLRITAPKWVLTGR